VRFRKTLATARSPRCTEFHSNNAPIFATGVVRRGRQEKRGANNAFGKVRQSIFRGRANENFRSLKRLIIFLAETPVGSTSSRPFLSAVAVPPLAGCCQPENGIRGGIGVDKIDKLSA